MVKLLIYYQMLLTTYILLKSKIIRLHPNRDHLKIWLVQQLQVEHICNSYKKCLQLLVLKMTIHLRFITEIKYA